MYTNARLAFSHQANFRFLFRLGIVEKNKNHYFAALGI